MEQMTRLPLSESTNGEAIHLLTLTSPGDLVHTAPTQGYDLVWMYASNIHTINVLTVIEWTGNDATTNALNVYVPDAIGALNIPIVRGLLLRGGAEVTIKPATTAVINIFGYVERYE